MRAGSTGLRHVTTLLAVGFFLAGCQSSHRGVRPASGPLVMADTSGQPYPQALDFVTDRGLELATPNADVRAAVTPPSGWRAEPLKSSPRHTHQLWLSPTGATAYGVSHFGHFLLFLAPDEAVLNEVIKGMQESSGSARIIEKEKDDQRGGTRFIAEAGPYRVRANMIRRGNEGWVIYAGTVRDRPTNPEELDLAERARDRTEPGLP